MNNNNNNYNKDSFIISPDKIFIEKPFKSQTNRVHVKDETATIAVPLCDAINKKWSKTDGQEYRNMKVEVAVYKNTMMNDNGIYHEGVTFGLRATEGESACEIFREGLEDMIIKLESILNLFENL
jgi:hypothetical protein